MPSAAPSAPCTWPKTTATPSPRCPTPQAATSTAAFPKGQLPAVGASLRQIPPRVRYYFGAAVPPKRRCVAQGSFDPALRRRPSVLVPPGACLGQKSAQAGSSGALFGHYAACWEIPLYLPRVLPGQMIDDTSCHSGVALQQQSTASFWPEKPPMASAGTASDSFLAIVSRCPGGRCSETLCAAA